MLSNLEQVFNTSLFAMSSLVPSTISPVMIPSRKVPTSQPSWLQPPRSNVAPKAYPFGGSDKRSNDLSMSQAGQVQPSKDPYAPENFDDDEYNWKPTDWENDETM